MALLPNQQQVFCCRQGKDRAYRPTDEPRSTRGIREGLREPAGEAGTLFVTVSQDGKRIRELVADDSDMDRVHLMGYELEEMGADKIFIESLSSAVALLHLLEE